MIHFLDEVNTTIGSFEHDDDLINDINNTENLKLLEENGCFADTQWSFVVLKPGHVHELYHHMKRPITEPLRKAYIQQIGLIEFFTGDFECLTQIPVTPGLNIGKLKNGWYLAYCKSRGYTITTNSDRSDGDKLVVDKATSEAELGDAQ